MPATQVAADRLLGLSRDTLHGLVTYVEGEEEGVLSFLQAVFKGADVRVLCAWEGREGRGE